MSDLPLLYFSKMLPGERDSAGRGGGGSPHSPDIERQAFRIGPKLQQLRLAFSQERASLSLNPDGIDPEYVLVLETRGTTENFLIAAKNTPGLEWLGDFGSEDLDPDSDFYSEDDASKKLKGRVFLSMANHQATLELITLFERYVKDSTQDLGYGRNSWKKIFNLLYDIRQWNENDRLEESGLFDDWKFRLQHEQVEIPVEIELWYRKDSEKRYEAEKHISKLVSELDGQVVKTCQIAGASYHAILAHLPNISAESIISDTSTKLLTAHQIMLFRPVGQCASICPSGDNKSSSKFKMSDLLPSSLDARDSVVALLDGVPMSNHDLLKKRIIVDDPDDFASAYRVDEQLHGTAMASLILHDELDSHFSPINTPLYVRPIMKPDVNDFSPTRREHIPEEELPVDLIHRAVVRMFEGDDGFPPVAPNVKIINLSIGDSSRPYIRMLSPLARLLDYLSWKYKVLFCVSAGNYCVPIAISSEAVNYADSERTAETLRAITEELRHRRIFSPAESVNALTIGAAHDDKSTPCLNPRQIDLVCLPTLPSLISAKGLGFNRAIKPDILYRGGRQLYLEPLLPDRPLSLVTSTHAPGQRVAAPSAGLGGTDNTNYICGTSNATALTSRYATYCCKVINELADNDINFFVDPHCTAPLVKAMLTHTATWGAAGAFIRTHLGKGLDERHKKNLAYKHLGYGTPSFSKVLKCTEKRVTIISSGALKAEKGHLYELPLPPSLSGVAVCKNLTITLAWLSPSVTTNQKYRSAALYFSPPQSELEVSRFDTDWQAVKRGTLQHERLQGDRAAAFIDGDSAKIKISCREDAGAFDEPIPYGLVMTVEVDKNKDIFIYEEIKDRLKTKVSIRPESSS